MNYTNMTLNELVRAAAQQEPDDSLANCLIKAMEEEAIECLEAVNELMKDNKRFIEQELGNVHTCIADYFTEAGDFGDILSTSIHEDDGLSITEEKADRIVEIITARMAEELKDFHQRMKRDWPKTISYDRDLKCCSDTIRTSFFLKPLRERFGDYDCMFLLDDDGNNQWQDLDDDGKYGFGGE